MADNDYDPTTQTGGGTGTRAPDGTEYDPTTQTGGGTGTRAPAPPPVAKPPAPRPSAGTPPPKPPAPPKPAPFFTPWRIAAGLALIVGAGYAAYEFAPRGRR